MALPFCFLILVCVCFRETNAGPEYDFEDSQEANVFTAENAKGTRAISTLHHKSGSHSLLWQWSTRATSDPPAKLTISLGPTLKLKEKEMKDGGLKFWMYRESTLPAAIMEIIFRGENGSSASAVATSPTLVHLNFNGWRGIWIGYQEFGSEMTSFTAITSVEFKVTNNTAGKLFLDAVRFATSIRKQSRDMVVPKVGSASRSNDPLFYDDKDFWQQSLRWHITPIPRLTSSTQNVDAKIGEIQGIEARLENWYAKVDEPLKTITAYDDFAVDMAMDPEGGIDYQALKQKRWKLLQTDIEAANTYYHKINFIKKSPPLFSKVEELGEDSISEDPNFKSKFGFFFARILLPLSLEYNFMSREAEVNGLANRVCNNLKSTNYLTMLQAITEITGNHHALVDAFQTILDTYKSKFTCSSKKAVDQVNAADLIHLYNEIRWERIKALLLFIEEQGWAEGSGLGSIDHEMNKAGSGFMHSMFLLRKTLRRSENTALLNRLLGTMKWYNDFNEIYQDDGSYIYDGTTADRMRTILLYRLMIILITPNSNKEVKVRDLEKLKVWMKHALKVNKGLGGVIKPDFTGFHHKTFYGSAYVPHALHNAALVQYLLEGTTSFKLDDTSKHNLREALSVLRTTVVKYSSPNGVGGRFPGYSNSILAQHFAAYAYISYSKEGSTEKAKGRDMFLRLFNHLEPSVKAYLEDGTIKSGIYYWNPIGQIDVFKQIATLPCTVQCSAENSPSGHWSKNFAGLSIHRRSNWAVAAKGFNRYVWDFEGNAGENVFGAFASQGSLQISNSESSLKSYDVTQGWDWTRVPGATTIKAELSNIALSKARNYNPGSFSGGVRFIGSTGSKPQNGAFGMYYKKPKYNLSKNKASPMDTMVFEFKKSYFFYNNLIVCLGSDIKFQSRDVSNYYAQTTLFQDKLVDPSKASTIRYRTTTHDLRLLLKRQKKWKSGETVTLVDTNGNTYQVKNAKKQGLSIQVQDQDSVAPNGCDKTEARYATAWIEHKNRQTLPCTTTVTTLTDNVENEDTQNNDHDEENIQTDDENEDNTSERNHGKQDSQSEITEKEASDSDNMTEKQPIMKKMNSSGVTSQTDEMTQKSKALPKKPKMAPKISNQKGIFTHKITNEVQHFDLKKVKKVSKPLPFKKNAAKLKTNTISTPKTNITNATFVNGLNVNFDNEPLQAAEVPTYTEPSIDYSTENILETNEDKPMFRPSHADEMTNQGIDNDEEGGQSPGSIDKNTDNDIKDGIDDKDDNYDNDDDKKNNEKEMDGLGTDINYDDGSTETESQSTNAKTATSSATKDATVKVIAAEASNVNSSVDYPTLEVDSTMASAQKAFTKKQTSVDMSKDATKTRFTKDRERQIDTKNSSDKETGVHKSINETITTESITIDPPPNELKHTINGTASSEDQIPNTDSNNDENKIKINYDNSVGGASNSIEQADTEKMKNKSIDSYIIGSNAETNASIDQEQDITNGKILTKTDDKGIANEGVSPHGNTRLDQGTQHRKDFKDENVRGDDENGQNESTIFDPKKHEREETDMSNENQVKSVETVKKLGNIKKAKPNANLKKVDKKKVKNNDKIEKQNNGKSDSKKNSNGNQSEGGGKEFATLENVDDDGLTKEETANSVSKLHKAKKDRKNIHAEITAHDASPTKTKNYLKPRIINTNQISQSNDNFESKDNSAESNTSQLSQQQRQKLKVMQQKHAEVKRKMKLKLKLKPKNVAYKKLHKAIKIAIQNAQQDKKDSEEENKNKFYFNNTLTNEDSSSEQVTIDKRSGRVDESVSYNDEAEHSDTTSTTTSSYEYAIVIQGGPTSLFSRYKVISQTGTVHAIELSNLPDYTDASVKLYAYSIFQNFAAAESISTGPVLKTSMPCMVMAELGTNTLHLALSNPAITFQDDPAMKNKDTCTKVGRKEIPDKFSPLNSDEVGAKMMFCVEGATTNIKVSLRLTKGLSTVLGPVKVDGKVQQNKSNFVSVNTASKEVTFLNLLNGLTTEVALRLV